MSRPIYKPISWMEAAEMLENKKTHGILLIEQGNYTLGNPFEVQIPLELLPIQRWYLRCEQEEQSECISSHHTHDDLPIRPEVSE